MTLNAVNLLHQRDKFFQQLEAIVLKPCYCSVIRNHSPHSFSLYLNTAIFLLLPLNFLSTNTEPIASPAALRSLLPQSFSQIPPCRPHFFFLQEDPATLASVFAPFLLFFLYQKKTCVGPSRWWAASTAKRSAPGIARNKLPKPLSRYVIFLFIYLHSYTSTFFHFPFLCLF